MEKSENTPLHILPGHFTAQKKNQGYLPLSDVFVLDILKNGTEDIQRKKVNATLSPEFKAIRNGLMMLFEKLFETG